MKLPNQTNPVVRTLSLTSAMQQGIMPSCCGAGRMCLGACLPFVGCVGACIPFPG